MQRGSTDRFFYDVNPADIIIEIIRLVTGWALSVRDGGSVGDQRETFICTAYSSVYCIKTILVARL